MRSAILIVCAMLPLQLFADDLLLSEATILSDEFLEESRGTSYEIDIDNVVATSEIEGISAGNTAINTQSGDNIISSGALGNASGISSVIQNTGNNVLIQNATVVNLRMH